jgi:hypothetical protein
MVAEAAAGGRNMEVGMDVKATAAATPTAGGLYTSYNGSLTSQQELTDDDGDDVENSSSSKGKLLVASEAAQLEALERRLSVRHLALQFETGQVNSHAEAAANKLAQETTDHVLEVKGSPTVAHSPNAADKDQEQRGNGHSHHGHHHHHHHHNHTSSTGSHGTAVTTPTTPTAAAAAAAQTTPKRRQHQCSSHKHATTPTTTRFDGAPVLRSSLRRTSGNLRECDRVSTHLSILLLLILPDFLIFSHLLLTKFPALQACGRNPFADSAAAAAPEFLIIVCCSTKWVESGGFSLAEPGSVWQCSTTSSGMV